MRLSTTRGTLVEKIQANTDVAITWDDIDDFRPPETKDVVVCCKEVISITIEKKLYCVNCGTDINCETNQKITKCFSCNRKQKVSGCPVTNVGVLTGKSMDDEDISVSFHLNIFEPYVPSMKSLSLDEIEDNILLLENIDFQCSMDGKAVSLDQCKHMVNKSPTIVMSDADGDSQAVSLDQCKHMANKSPTIVMSDADDDSQSQ